MHKTEYMNNCFRVKLLRSQKIPGCVTVDEAANISGKLSESRAPQTGQLRFSRLGKTWQVTSQEAKPDNSPTIILRG